MTREDMLTLIKPKMTEHRYTHTLGVLDTAIHLATLYGADSYKAEVAAIFHDYCKFHDREEMQQIIRNVEEIPKDLLNYHHELWHAPVGAYLVEKEVGITDQEILSAIRFHTTGRAQMTILEKIIFLADYIEPGRYFPGVEDVRLRAKEDLDHAVLQALANTIRFLEMKKQAVYPLTREAYVDLSKQKGGLL